MLQHLFGQQGQAFRRDKTVFFTHRQQHFMRRLDGARRAQRHVPALNAVLPGQILQLLDRSHFGPLEVFTGNGAAGEVHLREADAAHATALHQARLKVFADHQLRRTTADVDHQLAPFFRLGMFNAHENQTRLLVSGDDLNRVGDHFFGPLEELRRVQRLAQRVGAHDANAGGREALQAFGKQRQAV